MQKELLVTIKNFVFEEKSLNAKKVKNFIADKSKKENEDPAIIEHFVELFEDFKEESEQTDGSFKFRDWTKTQVNIMMLFLNEKPKELQMLDAFDAIGEVLDKPRSGVQYKYYETKKGRQFKSRGRKKKAVQSKPVILENKNKAEVASAITDAASEQITWLESSDAKPAMAANATQEVVKQTNDAMSNETPVAATPTVQAASPSYPVKANAESNSYEEPKEQNNSKQNQSVSDLLTSMIGNFGFIGARTKSKNDRYNDLYNLFLGLFSLSEMAKDGVSLSEQTKEFDFEFMQLKARNNHLENEYKETVSHLNQISALVENFKNTDEMRQLTTWKSTITEIDDILNKTIAIPKNSNEAPVERKIKVERDGRVVSFT